MLKDMSPVLRTPVTDGICISVIDGFISGAAIENCSMFIGSEPNVPSSRIAYWLSII